MKKGNCKQLVCVTSDCTIVEYHLNNQACLDRLIGISKRFHVITHSITEVVKHVELVQPPQLTETRYSEVE